MQRYWHDCSSIKQPPKRVLLFKCYRWINHALLLIGVSSNSLSLLLNKPDFLMQKWHVLALQTWVDMLCCDYIHDIFAPIHVDNPSFERWSWVPQYQQASQKVYRDRLRHMMLTSARGFILEKLSKYGLSLRISFGLNLMQPEGKLHGEDTQWNYGLYYKRFSWYWQRTTDTIVPGEQDFLPWNYLK